MVYDAFRSFETQYEIYESFREAILKENQNISEYELDRKLSEMVSKPIKQLDLPPFHSTGGAVDLTICINGRPLNMGTEFDSTSEKAHTDYYETSQIDSQAGSQAGEIKHNRRLLYHIMTESGFVNYSYEWWHYSYGDRLWSAINKCDAIYGMVDKI